MTIRSPIDRKQNEEDQCEKRKGYNLTMTCVSDFTCYHNPASNSDSTYLNLSLIFLPLTHPHTLEFLPGH